MWFFLRCLRDLEKWSWIEKMRKNEEKWLPQNPQTYTTHAHKMSRSLQSDQ